MDEKLTMKVYQGSPNDIIEKVGKEISEALGAAGIPPLSINILGLLHVVACSIRSGKESWEKGDKDLGLMPSYKMVLKCLTHSMTGTEWTEAEVHEFNEEFIKIIQSLGGERVGMVSHSKDQMPFLAPLSKEIH